LERALSDVVFGDYFAGCFGSIGSINSVTKDMKLLRFFKGLE